MGDGEAEGGGGECGDEKGRKEPIGDGGEVGEAGGGGEELMGGEVEEAGGEGGEVGKAGGEGEELMGGEVEEAGGIGDVGSGDAAAGGKSGSRGTNRKQITPRGTGAITSKSSSLRIRSASSRAQRIWSLTRVRMPSDPKDLITNQSFSALNLRPSWIPQSR